MNKSDLVAKLVAETGATASTAGRVLDALGQIATKELKSGGEVTLPGLGKLKASQSAARTGRNPSTGEAIEIPAKIVAKFSVSTVLKNALN